MCIRDSPEGEMGLRDHAILEVLYGCGLRVSELVGLDVGDIHIDDGFVLVRGTGSKERLSPLVGSAARALALYVTAVSYTHLIVNTFITGAADMMSVVLVIALARGCLLYTSRCV